MPSGPEGRQDGRRSRWVLALALAGSALLAHSPALRNGFVNYDDDLYLVHNPHLRLGLTPAGVAWAFTTFHGANWFPLTWLSWMADHAIFGPDPAAFHRTNLALHALSAALLFLALTRMTGAPLRSAFVAGVFGLHPLHVESVAWAAVRKDVLSGLFWMLALLAYARYAERPTRARYLVTAASMALGLMAKPMLVTLPFVLLLLDWWPLGRLGAVGGTLDAARVRRAVLDKLPLVALAAASSAVTVVAQRSAGAVQPLEAFSLGTRALNALLAYAGYLRRAFWPHGLAAYYPHPGDQVSVAGAASAGLFLAAVTAGVLTRRHRHPYAAVGWFWFVGTLVPVIGLVQVGSQAMADRYTYLPLIGLSTAVAWGAADILRRSSIRIGPVLAAACLAALGVATWRQAHVWRDSETLFRHALAATRDNAVAHLNLGLALFEKGRLPEAACHLEAALRIHPGAAEAQAGLGEVRAAEGRFDEARERFAAAVRLDPRLARARNSLGRLLVETGAVDEGLVQLREAIAVEPSYAEPYNNLGAALVGQGSFSEAIEYLRKAVALEPSYAEAHNNWGVALMNRGELREAAERFRTAVSLRPAYARAHNNWGLALAGDGKLAEAVERFERAVELAPGEAEAHHNLGLALANLSDLDRAARHFEAAVTLDPRHAEAHHGLGLALAGLGRQPEAVARFREAVALRRDYAEAHDALAVALASQGSMEEAERHFREAIRARPGYAQAHYNWGLALVRAGRNAEAVARFRDVLAADPDHADAHLNLGVALAGQGRLDEAAEHFRHVLRIDPDRADARGNLDKVLAASQRGSHQRGSAKSGSAEPR